jgi:rubrerythrin
MMESTQLAVFETETTKLEMTDVIASKIFLEVCMGIETLCADLYHYYSEAYEDVPEASRLWKKTAIEEENHKMQFELALRLMNETEFEVPKESLKLAYSIQYKLLKLTDLVKSNKPELLTAVSKAIEMEDKLANLHVHTALKFKDESIRRLFKALSEDDCGHVSNLQRYQTILRLPNCEMEG